MTDEPRDGSNVSRAYLIFMYGVGFGLIAVLAYAGANHWNFLGTVLIGGLAQLAFRLTKRYWKNSVNDQLMDSDGEREFSLFDYRDLVAAYGVLCIVSALWYGMGWSINRIFS